MASAQLSMLSLRQINVQGTAGRKKGCPKAYQARQVGGAVAT